jgi:enoyl-CoA hydratase/carnithine racemase
VSAGDPIVVSTEGAVGRLVLNVPERRNAMSYSMRDLFAEALTAFDENAEVRVVVLTGAGTAFCAGVDLADAGERPPGESTKRLTWALEQFSKPVLAAINGPAVGGGLELALASDLRIASSNAWFALPEVKIGSLPGSGGTQRLPRAVSAAVAAKLVLTGERLDAADALRYGLVSDVVEPEALQPLADELASRIAANAPLSLRAAKVALRAAAEQPLAEGLKLERALWEMLASTSDREEGRAAFREHRPPRFTGS